MLFLASHCMIDLLSVPTFMGLCGLYRQNEAVYLGFTPEADS